jgi:uracil-DNA glycosylase
MTLLNPCIGPIGPRDAKLVLVGEAPGDQEERTGIPFIGWAGQELRRLFLQAGLDWNSTYFTNVLFSRPPENKLEKFCVSKIELPASYPMPALSPGKYLHPDLLPELDRLWGELLNLRPNLIIAAGATAAWAILRLNGITRLRGTIHGSKFGKVLPILHPALLAKGPDGWSNRPVMVADLMKAAVEKEFPEIRRPVRHVLIDPTLPEVEEWRDVALATKLLACDIETRGRSITCVGFSSSSSSAIVIPFFDARKLAFDPELGLFPGSYWTRQGEIRVRRIINDVLSSSVPKLFQNGLFDVQHLLSEGYRIRNFAEDTMILHHALYPEMRKDLGFLGSIYTNETAWKLMRPRGDHSEKQED